MKVGQALCRSRPYLNDVDKDKAETRLVCEVLLRHIMGLSRTELYASMEREITAAQEASWAALINRYVAGEPVAYILGEREFYGRNFIVAPGVLIPRPETELLVEKVCSLVGDSYGVIADIGTGSGAIAISLAMEIGHFCVWATDISATALKIAAENCRRYETGDRVSLFRGNLLEPLPGAVDIVVANLPYVKESELGHLPTFEPELAFNGGPEGLDVITDFIAQLKGKLRNGGVVLLEVGLGQAGAVADLLKHYRSDIRIEIISDFSRIDRVVCGFLA